MDCHAFEFMQRALQDLRKTAYSLDSRVSASDRPGGSCLGVGGKDPSGR